MKKELIEFFIDSLEIKLLIQFKSECHYVYFDSIFLDEINLLLKKRGYVIKYKYSNNNYNNEIKLEGCYIILNK